MKQLTLNKPLVLMVIGLPGAGKSFFARQFADTFGVARVSIDRLRSLLLANPTFDSQETTILGQLQHHIISEFLKTRRTFIIDGGINARVERQAVEQLAKRHDFDSLIIWVQTDQTTAQLRSGKRNPKKIEDVHNVSLTPDQFNRLAKRLSTSEREQYIVISGKHPYSTQARAVLRRLATPHQQAANQAHKQEVRTPRKPTSPVTRGIVVN